MVSGQGTFHIFQCFFHARLKRKAIQQPKYWETFSDKAMRMFKHALNPKANCTYEKAKSRQIQPKDRWEVRDMRKLVEKERLMKSKVKGARHLEK